MQAKKRLQIVAYMSHSPQIRRPVHRIEISRSALESNVRVFREIAPDSLFMAVVKSNAYGHDLDRVVEALSGKVDWFGVNGLPEARRLRQLDAQTPVLVMGLNVHDLAQAHADSLAIPAGLTVVVSSMEALDWIAANAPEQSFHLKVDTGLSRLGANGAGLDACLEFLKAHPQLAWTGLMTHFANVEDVTDQSYALEQLARFTAVRERAREAAGERRLIVHAAASAPALILPDARLDLIRVGISLYGLWPSNETRLSALSQLERLPELRPVLRWLTRIVHVHDVPAGANVGYGCTYQTPADTRVATLPVGYYEGYERALSSRAHVLIHGRRAPVLGRVSMNMIVVDVGHIPGVAAGDEAVLLGRAEVDDASGASAEEVSAEDLAELTGTINYEVVTRILADLPRVPVD
ncbi:MAG: alanine racemase [bacterium]|nr:alanine racemase [bacterium]